MFFYIFVFNLLMYCLAEKVEFCTWQIFQPRCSKNEIIVIEEAVFGRKTMGRCLSEEGVSMENNLEDPKFLGCYADVKDYLEQQCAGKKQCDIYVVNIQVETNCHKWLKFHLEVDYSCLPVVQESRHCSVSLSDGKQFIASYQDLKNGCGSRNQPWILESLAGQSISASVVHVKDSFPKRIQFLTPDREHQSSCNSLGKFVDKQNRKEHLLCLLPESSTHFETNRYLSSSNSIEVVLFGLKNLSLGYVLAFEAVGCSDLIPPADAWLKRTENEATIGCYSTRLRWQLKCLGQRWIGVIGNCSQGQHLFLRPERVDQRSEAISDNQTVTIFLIVVSGLVLCMLITCTGVVFLKIYYTVSRSKALKQMSMNGRMDCGMSLEKNGSVLGNTTRKGFHDTNGKAFFQDSSDKNDLQYKDNCQYFELDGSLLDKDTNLNVAQ